MPHEHVWETAPNNFGPLIRHTSSRHTDPAALRSETFEYDIRIGTDKIEQVKVYKYLGSMTTADGSLMTEIRKRIAIARKRTQQMSRVWKQKKFSGTTKKMLFRTVIMPTASYGCDAWAPTPAESKTWESGVMKIARTAFGMHRREKKKGSGEWIKFTNTAVRAVADIPTPGEILRTARLRLRGQMERIDSDLMSALVRHTNIGTRKGGHRKAWNQLVLEDKTARHLEDRDMKNKNTWNTKIQAKRPS